MGIGETARGCAGVRYRFRDTNTWRRIGSGKWAIENATHSAMYVFGEGGQKSSRTIGSRKLPKVLRHICKTIGLYGVTGGGQSKSPRSESKPHPELDFQRRQKVAGGESRRSDGFENPHGK